jgi:hypothetical protein
MIGDYIQPNEFVEDYTIIFNPHQAEFKIITNIRTFILDVPYGSARFKELMNELDHIIKANHGLKQCCGN